MTLAPTSSIVPIATEVGAERRMYLPLVAVVVLVVVSVVRLWDAIKPRLGTHAQAVRFATVTAMLVLAGVSAALAMGTVTRNGEYASELELAQATLERYPTPVGHHWLAECLIRADRRDEAMVHLRQAVPAAPRAHYTLGLELFKDRKLDEAIYHLKEFLAKQPRLVWASNAYGLLGQAYWAQENWPAAIDAFRALLQRTPDNPIAHYSLAEVLAGDRQFAEAIDHYRVYLVSNPEDPSALNSFGRALAMAGRDYEALAPLQRAVELNPKVGSFQHNLALALVGNRRLDAALLHARLAVELQPENAESRELLRALESTR
jgi:tetratricopeptide (TPR) repeat protein